MMRCTDGSPHVIAVRVCDWALFTVGAPAGPDEPAVRTEAGVEVAAAGVPQLRSSVAVQVTSNPSKARRESTSMDGLSLPEESRAAASSPASVIQYLRSDSPLQQATHEAAVQCRRTLWLVVDPILQLVGIFYQIVELVVVVEVLNKLSVSRANGSAIP